MAYGVFALGAVLAAAGFFTGAMSINLVPTEIGLLYAACGAIFVSCGAIVAAVAALIARVDKWAAGMQPDEDLMRRAGRILQAHGYEDDAPHA